MYNYKYNTINIMHKYIFKCVLVLTDRYIDTYI